MLRGLNPAGQTHCLLIIASDKSTLALFRDLIDGGSLSKSTSEKVRMEGQMPFVTTCMIPACRESKNSEK
jgi:hypothetical protein